MKIDSINVWASGDYTRPTGASPASAPGAPQPDGGVTAPAPGASAGPGASKTDGNTEDGEGNAKEKSLLERILEHGFSQFVADLEKEKLAKMREEILGAMGLTEEDLAKLPPDQRKLIEEMIASEIRRRLEAASAMNRGDRAPKGEATVSAGSIAAGTAATASAGQNSAGGVAGANGDATAGTKKGHETGLGVLLALQEIDAAKAARAEGGGEPKPGKDRQES